MCGIAGLVSTLSLAEGELSQSFGLVLEKLSLRGPNNRAYWSVPGTPVMALGHTRLSILDLSDHANQPMHSQCGNLTICFNGEIYNHLELRKKHLSKFFSKYGDDFCWKTTSDTETILELAGVLPIETLLNEMHGMFSLAMWNNSLGLMYLVRDRFGEKPLYIYNDGKTFGFSSDPVCFFDFPGVSPELNEEGVKFFLNKGYCSQKIGFFDCVYQLLPGHYAVFKPEKFCFEILNYFNPVDFLSSKKKIKSSDSLEYFVDELQEKFEHVISEMLVADAPVGSFLSGGIDSSLITAIMQKISSKRIPTFSISFAEDEFNEGTHAQKISNYLGTNHHNILFKAEDALSITTEMPKVYGEPFADSSQIPTVLLSKIASESITVALGGDGGDEFFAGYNRHSIQDRLLQVMRFTPPWLINPLTTLLIQNLPKLYYSLGRNKIPEFDHKLSKLTSLFGSKSIEDTYQRLTTSLGLGLHSDSFGISCRPFPESKFEMMSTSEQIMILDVLNYLPEDVLTKVDRASMYSSMEVRAPFLHPVITDFALKLPFEYKVGKLGKKTILKALLNKYVPQEYFDRPKQGFAIPLAGWLRIELREWAEEMMANEMLYYVDGLDMSQVKVFWSRLLAGQGQYQHYIWNVAMLSSWLRHNKNRLIHP